MSQSQKASTLANIVGGAITMIGTAFASWHIFTTYFDKENGLLRQQEKYENQQQGEEEYEEENEETPEQPETKAPTVAAPASDAPVFVMKENAAVKLEINTADELMQLQNDNAAEEQ